MAKVTSPLGIGPVLEEKKRKILSYSKIKNPKGKETHIVRFKKMK